MKKSVMFAGLLASSLLASPYLMAELQTKPAASPQVVQAASKAPSKTDKDAINAQIKKQQALLKETNKDVGEGLSNVVKAMKFMSKDQNKEAISALKAASGSFDVALAANPDIGLIPIDVGIRVNQLITTPDELKAQVKLAKKLLGDYKVQEARAVLVPLKDDIETSTVFLPMETYPDAIKQATKLLVDGDKEGAMVTLEAALSTMVTEYTTIPLTLVRADRMIEEAASLDSKVETEKKLALDLLSDADEQLKLATLLGYTDKNSELYEDISAQIKALKKEITGGNAAERLYKKLKNSVKGLIGKHSEHKEVKKEDKK